MATVIEKVKRDMCTGCGACKNICPVDAISMQMNKEGFIYPVIDYSKCVNCGKCVNTCPVHEPKYKNKKNPECLAVWAKDEIRMKSASGGVFSAFAEYVLENGGYICGAAWADEWAVEHIVGNSEEDLDKIRNSKYVQSDIANSYKEIKNLLSQKEMVLFCGTPCQVAGLYAYLEHKEYKNLYTMDLVCHGVPSPKVLRKYVKEKFADKPIKNIDFRAKDVYGWCSSITVTFEDGEVYRDTHDRDIFYRAFLPCIALRKSCEQCPFSKLPRQGDLTIGDFWGIDRYNPQLNDRKGTSVVLVNNNQGKKILNLIEGKISVKERVPMEYAVHINKTIEKPFKAHYGRKHFFQSLDILPLEKLVTNSIENHYDVGVVGLWYGFNYGSILTYYALYEVLKQYGYDPFMMAKPSKMWLEKYADKQSLAGRFIYPRCNVMNYRNHDYDWNMMNNHCDAFIVGSDVVWNYEICGREAGSFFFLDWVKDSKKKIAYASSFGQGYNAPAEVQAKDKYYFKKFDAVAVREQEAVDICAEKFQVHADMVLDPVFLCDKEIYYRIARSQKKIQQSIMAYILGANIEKRNILVKMSEKLGLNLRIYANPNNETRGKEILQLPIVEGANVENWLADMMNCEYFIGDSFHGLCFALIFQKKFVCVVNKDISGLVRFTNLLRICGLEDRLVYTDTSEEKIFEIMTQEIDYVEVFSRLEPYLSYSENWLKTVLAKPKEIQYGDSEKMYELEERINEICKKYLTN